MKKPKKLGTGPFQDADQPEESAAYKGLSPNPAAKSSQSQSQSRPEVDSQNQRLRQKRESASQLRPRRELYEAGLPMQNQWVNEAKMSILKDRVQENSNSVGKAEMYQVDAKP